MEEIIHKGIESAARVIEDIQARVVQDSVNRTAAARIEQADGTWKLAAGDILAPLHSHAFAQVVNDAGMPKKYADELAQQANGTPWGRELVAHNLNTILSHRDKQRNLIRREGGQVKGFLSDRFRRLDSRPLLDAFIGSAQELGLVPIQGVGTDTKVRVRAVLPQVFEPVASEVMLFGLEWGNSDYGDGGHCVNLWTMRVWCTNLAVTDECLRQIHLGRRLADDIAYSEQTYRLDTQANASALRDTVRHAIGPARINGMLEAIKTANTAEIKGRDGVAKVLGKALGKADAEKAADLFEGNDVVNLPPGNTVWRLSNAVSWLAQGKNLSTDRKLELERVAGELIPHQAVKAREV